MYKIFYLYENDKDGSTVVVIPIKDAESAFEAQKIANKFFKERTTNLHVRPGIRTGEKAETLDDLFQNPNCWMVWR